MSWKIFFGVLLSAALASSGCGSGASSGEQRATDERPVVTVKTVTAITTTPEAPSLADLVDQVQSGVIRIESETCDGKAIGTGFIIGPRLVATVEHVVDGATRVHLKQAGKTLGTGTVIGVDRDRDVALVRTAKPLDGYVFSFADDAPRLGDSVAALGFPLGLPLSVTDGAISGEGRVVPIDGVRRRGLLQTDASLNAGNSGGPLIDKDTGDVVGLVDIGTDAHGISFAVNSDVAAALIEAWQSAPQPVAAAVCDYDPAPAESSSETVDQQAPDAGGDAEVYDGNQFSIAYPGTWVVDAAEESKSFGTDTTIIDPANENRLIRVDVSPHAAGSAMTQARPVIDSLRRDATYTELGLDSVDFQGYDAVHWEFTIDEDGRRVHKEDLFFTDDYGRGVAILTQAPAAEYEDYWPLFDAVRNSYVAY